MLSEDFFLLGEVDENLRKSVAKLEIKMNPNTPPKVLETQHKVGTKKVQNIQKAKVLCAKEYAQVSQLWETLLDDAELEKVTKKLHTREENMIGLRNELKKFALVEKMSKAAAFKILQEQVAKLWTQQQRRTEHVAKLQAKVEQVIGTIHLVHERV